MATLPQITRSPEGATGPTHFRTLVPVYHHHTKIENNSFKLCTSTPTTEFLSKVLTLKKASFSFPLFCPVPKYQLRIFRGSRNKNIPPPPAIITRKQTTDCVTRLSGPGGCEWRADSFPHLCIHVWGSELSREPRWSSPLERRQEPTRALEEERRLPVCQAPSAFPLLTPIPN